MKTFKYTIAGHAVTIRLDEKQGTIADLLVDDKHPAVDVISMQGSQQKEKACILNDRTFNIQALFRFRDYSNSMVAGGLVV